MKTKYIISILLLICLIILGIINYKIMVMLLVMLTIAGFILWIFIGGSKPKKY